MERIIQEAIRDAVNAEVEAVTECAIADVRRRIAEQKAVIVMTVLRGFNIARNRNEILITVQDTTQP
jgi:hypothetical protein